METSVPETRYNKNGTNGNTNCYSVNICVPQLIKTNLITNGCRYPVPKFHTTHLLYGRQKLNIYNL